MLAAMTSLMAIAGSGPAAAPAFNADFYVAAATVIPVLYLAIAVQGPGLHPPAQSATRGHPAHEHSRDAARVPQQMGRFYATPGRRPPVRLSYSLMARCS